MDFITFCSDLFWDSLSILLPLIKIALGASLFFATLLSPFIFFSSFCYVFCSSKKNSTPSGDEDIKNGKAG